MRKYIINLIIQFVVFFTCFSAYGQKQSIVYSLDKYCSISTVDIAPIINRLLQTGDVYIPSGCWKLSSKIKLPSGRDIIGEDVNNTFFYADEPLRMIEVIGNDNEIRNINFRGSNITEKASYIIYKLRGTKKLLVENCAFEGATGGIFIDAVCDSIYVRGCNFSKMYPCKQRISSGYGIVFNHNDKKRERGIFYGAIERNIFHDSIFRHSIYLQSSEHIEVKDNVFYGLNEQKDTSYEFQIEIRGCRDLLFEGNLSRGGYGFINGTESVYHGHGSDFLIKNNVFLDNINSENNLGVINVKFHNVTIKDNVFGDYNTIGIYVASVDGTTIERNRFVSKYAETCSIVDLVGRKVGSFTIKNNIFSRGGNPQTPAVNIQKSQIKYLDISDNIYLGGELGINLQDTHFDSLIMSNNSYDGELCRYLKNTIKESVIYKNNKAAKHPTITTPKDIKVQISDNTMPLDSYRE